MEQFIDDDAGYKRWISDHPNGFVVNSDRHPSPLYLVLHRATCGHMTSAGRTNWTTTGYIKTCSLDLAELEAWAHRQTGGTLKPCPTCKPSLASQHRSVEAIPRSDGSGSSSPRYPLKASHVRTQPTSATGRVIPATISTGCSELDLVWQTYARSIVNSHILIPDTEDDLNRHAFLGHSVDMQGFRAAEFAGVDPLTRRAPDFRSLQERGIGIPELASLWEIPAVQQHLRAMANGTPFSATLNVLKSSGCATGRSLAEAFAPFPYRKGHRHVRALLWNSATLREFGYSFRRWLATECAKLDVEEFPPLDFRQDVVLGGRRMTLEKALRVRLEKTFYLVGPAMSPYMLCDWQQWLWNQGLTGVFANFKLDSFHQEFVARYARGMNPTDEDGFAAWWLGLFPDLPPRLANECIWLGREYRLV